MMPLDIVYQDCDLVVIDKPAGLLVHPTELDARECYSAMQILRDQLDTWVYPVHRLDRATSGLLVFGLSKTIAAQLSQQFAERVVEKLYHALLRGWLVTDSLDCLDNEQLRRDMRTVSLANSDVNMRAIGLSSPAWREVDYALAKPKAHLSAKLKRSIRRIQATGAQTKIKGDEEISEEGSKPIDLRKPALTRFRTRSLFEYDQAVDRYSTARYSLVEVKPQTGRPHQIRRHAKHLSHPIVGDAKYGNASHNRFFSQKLAMPGLMLSAVSLAFDHPSRDQRIELSCPPAPALAQLVDCI